MLTGPNGLRDSGRLVDGARSGRCVTSVDAPCVQPEEVVAAACGCGPGGALGGACAVATAGGSVACMSVQGGELHGPWAATDGAVLLRYWVFPAQR